MSAYNCLAALLERVRMATLISTPDINSEVTMGMVRAIPGRVSSPSNSGPCTVECAFPTAQTASP